MLGKRLRDTEISHLPVQRQKLLEQSDIGDSVWESQSHTPQNPLLNKTTNLIHHHETKVSVIQSLLNMPAPKNTNITS